MTRVSTQLSADASAYVREMQKINAELLKNTQALEKMTAINNRAAQQAKADAQEQESALGKVGEKIASLAAYYISAQAAARLVTAEMQNQLDIQTKMSAAQRTLESSERELAFNVGDASKVPAARQAARSLAAQLGQPIENANMALGQAIAAQGGGFSPVNVEQARMAMRFRPDDQGAQEAIAFGLGNFKKLTGTDDPTKNMNYALAMGSQALPSDIRATFQHLLVGAIGAKGYDSAGNDKYATALVDAMTQVSADEEGRRSATASVALAGQLQQFFKVPSQLMGLPQPSLQQEVEFMQSNRLTQRMKERGFKSLAEVFTTDKGLGGFGATFEKKMEVPVQELLTGGSAGAGMLQQFLSDLDAVDPKGAEKMIAAMGDSEAAQTGAVSRRAQSAKQFAQTRDVNLARMGAVRQELGDIQQALGYSALGQTTRSGALTAAGLFGQETQIEELRSQLLEANRFASQQGNKDISTQLERLIGTMTNVAAEIRNANRVPTNTKAHGE